MKRRPSTFDPALPVERASTPPSSWYTDASWLEIEKREIFDRTWQGVGPVAHVREAGDYLSGEIAGEPFVVVRGGDGQLRGFYNVCRHHASCIVAGRGRTERLVCPYHGWEYELDGRLARAPRLGQVEDFDRERFSLVPIDVAVWGNMVFARLCSPAGADTTLEDLLAPLAGRFDCESLYFVERRSYELRCNWKVFVDNYLDGGYHVAHLHGGLASQLDLDSYRTEICDRISLQICTSTDDGRQTGADGADFRERLGSGAIYAFIYPNFMINRYGPIMDTNWVLPLGHDRTLTIFDYYFEESAREQAGFVERSLTASDRVQQEDVGICESVQRGLASSAFDTGRYAAVEGAALHFHRLLAADLVRPG